MCVILDHGLLVLLFCVTQKVGAHVLLKVLKVLSLSHSFPHTSIPLQPQISSDSAHCCAQCVCHAELVISIAFDRWCFDLCIVGVGILGSHGCHRRKWRLLGVDITMYCITLAA